MINIKLQATTNNNGNIETEEVEYKYSVGQTAYYLYKNFFGRWKILETEIVSIVFTNMKSYQLLNSWIAAEWELYDSYEDAYKALEVKKSKKKYLK